MYRFSLLPGEYLVVASPPTVSARLSTIEDIGRTGRGSGELAALLSRGTLSALRVGDALVGLGRGAAIPPPPVGGRVRIYPPTFYPSTLSAAQAAHVAVAAGEARAGINLQLQPVSTFRVSGTVVGTQGPASMATVRLVPEEPDDAGMMSFAPISEADANGDFTFPAVAPGRYSLRSTTGRGRTIEWTTMPVTVGGSDIDGLAAVLRPGVRVSGRLEFEGTAPPPGQTRGVDIALETVDGMAATAQSTISWEDRAESSAPSFTVGGNPRGRYIVRVSQSPAGWMFKSATLDGIDVSETPFELTRDVGDLVVTFTDRWTGVSGTAQQDVNQEKSAVVLVFPVESQRWVDYGSTPRRLKSAVVSASGTFGISALPPGEYYIAAVPEAQAEEWRDPRTLDAIARTADRLSIADGGHRTVNLRVQAIR